MKRNIILYKERRIILTDSSNQHNICWVSYQLISHSPLGGHNCIDILKQAIPFLCSRKNWLPNAMYTGYQSVISAFTEDNKRLTEPFRFPCLKAAVREYNTLFCLKCTVLTCKTTFSSNSCHMAQGVSHDCINRVGNTMYNTA